MASTYTTNNYPGNTVTITNGGSSYTTSGVTLNTGIISAGGAGGGYLTSNGAGTSTYTTSWAQPNQNFVSNNGKTLMSIPYNEEKVVLEKAATLEINGNVVMNGMDLDERLKTIEKVLCIPQRDVTMETKHPKLKKLYEQYMHELEKYRTWDRVKGDQE